MVLCSNRLVEIEYIEFNSMRQLSQGRIFVECNLFKFKIDIDRIIILKLKLKYISLRRYFG